MSEPNIIRKQQLKNMLYNLVAFVLIFTAFGFIVFNQVRLSLYSKLDSELTVSQKSMENLLQNRTIGSGQKPAAANRPNDDNFIDPRSPRVIPLLRDVKGQIINFGSVNDVYYTQYLQSLPFDQENLNKIISLKIQNQYDFRSLLVSVPTSANGQMYLQLLINADSETALLQQMSYIIAFAIILFTALSIAASYILSQKAMRPVKRAWQKQVEFVENVSHELRTPLTIIQNSLEMLLTVPEQKIISHTETLAMVLNETSRLSKLVTDMLTLARSDSTMTELSLELFSLDLLVQQVSEPYLELAASQQKDFQLDLNCPGNIRADKNRIHQLLVILFDNALKYTGPLDRIMVQTELKENKACLSVADTGIGISDEAREKIFDRFYREDKARAHDRNGTGLGLSIATWIIDKHNGTIKVKPNQPKGSIFIIKIPK
jgi:two-component system sensor histidine kinase CiaH